MKRLIFSRVGIITLLILIEIILVVLYFNQISRFANFYFRDSWIISFFMFLYFFNSKQNISVKVSWMVLISILPIVGTLLYWFIYLDIGYGKTKKSLKKIKEETKNILPNNDFLYENLDSRIVNISKFLKKEGNFNIYSNTKVTYFSQGELAFKEMLIRLENAKEYIFMEYFLIEIGYMWDKILEILKQKVLEGVEVRLMYDGSSVYYKMPYNYQDILESYGIKVKIFCALKPFISTQYNNRDHRKIMVIDGIVSFTGGVNLSDTHINKENHFGHWKDTAICMEGDASKEFTLMFLQMWDYEDGKSENYDKYFKNNIETGEKSILIPYAFSPFEDNNLAENVYLDMINNAKEKIYITSPYFVPTDEMINTLVRAANKGIDIRILLPKLNDSKIAYHLARSYYFYLISSGVKIYEYSAGFVHAKMISIDNEIAIVGTINMDYRSLYHHFECACIIYDENLVKEIVRDIKYSFDISHKIREKDFKKEKIYHKMYRAVLRFIAPLI